MLSLQTQQRKTAATWYPNGRLMSTECIDDVDTELKLIFHAMHTAYSNKLPIRNGKNRRWVRDGEKWRDFPNCGFSNACHTHKQYLSNHSLKSAPYLRASTFHKFIFDVPMQCTQYIYKFNGHTYIHSNWLHWHYTLCARVRWEIEFRISIIDWIHHVFGIPDTIWR